MKACNSNISIEDFVVVLVVLLNLYFVSATGIRTNRILTPLGDPSNENKVEIEVPMQRRLEEEVRRRIEAVKNEIKREIERRERARQIRENNAKYDELVASYHNAANDADACCKIRAEGAEDMSEENRSVNGESNAFEGRAGRSARRKRNKDLDGIGSELRKTENGEETSGFFEKLPDANDSLGSDSGSTADFLFLRKNSQFFEKPAQRFKGNSSPKFSRPSILRRKRRRLKHGISKRTKTLPKAKLTRNNFLKNDPLSMYAGTFPKTLPTVHDNGALWRFKRV